MEDTRRWERPGSVRRRWMDNAAKLKTGLKLEQPRVDHAPVLARFEQEDPGFVERLTPEFYGDPEGWIAEIGDGGRLGWVALLEEKREDEPIGFVDLAPDSVAGVAYMAFYVATEHRGRGFGSQLVRLAAARAEESNVRVLVAYAREDDLPARRSLERGGFTKVASVGDGTVYYTFDTSARYHAEGSSRV